MKKTAFIAFFLFLNASLSAQVTLVLNQGAAISNRIGDKVVGNEAKMNYDKQLGTGYSVYIQPSIYFKHSHGIGLLAEQSFFTAYQKNIPVGTPKGNSKETMNTAQKFSLAGLTYSNRQSIGRNYFTFNLGLGYYHFKDDTDEDTYNGYYRYQIARGFTLAYIGQINYAYKFSKYMGIGAFAHYIHGGLRTATYTNKTTQNETTVTFRDGNSISMTKYDLGLFLTLVF